MTLSLCRSVSVAVLLVGVALPGGAWASADLQPWGTPHTLAPPIWSHPKLGESPFQFTPEPALTGQEVAWIEAPLGNGAYVDYSTTLNNVAAFVSSSLGGGGGSIGSFTQAGVGSPIAATTTGTTGALPVAPGQSVLLVNKSAGYAATCSFGGSDAGAAYFIPASQSQEIGIPVGAALITCTGIGGTATINVIGGAGLFAGAGGGGSGGGGGGGGTVTQGTAAAPSGAWPVYNTVGGAGVSAANPLPMGFGTGVTLPAFGTVPTVTVGNFPSSQAVTFASAPSVKLQDGSGNPIGSIGSALNVNGTFTGSVGGFVPGVIGTPIVATTGGVTGTLPAGTAVMAINVGANPAYCQMGASASGITNAKQLSPGQQWAIGVGSATQMTCASTTSTTQINLIGGSGLGVDTAGTGSAASNVVVTNFPATQPISAAALPLPTGAATAALQPAINADAGAQVHVMNLPATQAISAAALPLPTGAATSALQTAGNASLAAIATGTPVALNGDGGAPAHVMNFPATQPVSGTFWQATQPVSGTVTANAGSGSFTVAQPTAANLNMTCANCTSAATATGTDGGTFTPSTSVFAPIGGVWQTAATSNPVPTSGEWAAAQITHYRALMTDWYNSSGTEMGTAGSPVQVSLANTGVNGSALAVSGTFWQATQPVSLAALPALATGANTIGALAANQSVNQTQIGGNAISTGTGASGTGTARVATSSDSPGGALANPAYHFVTDGVNTASVKAASTSAAAGDKSLVVQINPQQTPAVGLSQVNGTAISATNGLFTNLSVANTAMTAANPLFAALSVGGAVDAVGNPIFVAPGTGATFAVTNAAEATALTTLNANIVNPPNLLVNGGNSTWSGLTPGTAQTGTIVAANMDLTSIGGQAISATHPVPTSNVNLPAGATQRWRGSTGAQTGTGAVSVSNSSLAANYTYITDLECGRSDAGTAAITVTLNDSAATILVVPNSGGGGGWTKTFGTPLLVSSAVNTALTVTAGSAVTSYYCSAQGYFATTLTN